MGSTLSSRLALVIGNFLVHYDSALFGLLAPFIAPLFFENTDPLTALILTYGMMPLGMIAKPLGSLFFGWLGDRFERRQVLFCSLLGMAIVTFLIGCLPLYCHVGILAPCLLALGKSLQSFFSAGESTLASIYVIENTPTHQRSLMSSFYDVSSMGGTLIASALITFFCMQNHVEEVWRLFFWIGGLTAIFGVFLRMKTQQEEYVEKRQRPHLLKVLIEHRKALIAIIVASGFSYTTYALPFVLMNGYVPLVTSLSKSDILQLNTALLVIDMGLLPCFGYLAHKWGKERVMLAGALCCALGGIPLFYLLDGAGMILVTLIRLAIVIFGVAFAAPYHAWKLEVVPPEHRYTILSLGCAFGSQLIGAPSSAICLWLYQQLGVAWAPGLYLMAIALLAWSSVYAQARTEKLKSPSLSRLQ